MNNYLTTKSRTIISFKQTKKKSPSGEKYTDDLKKEKRMRGMSYVRT
jgi:hypothetical protein